MKPYFDMSQYQYELGIYYGRRCLIAAAVLATFGAIGLRRLPTATTPGIG